MSGSNGGVIILALKNAMQLSVSPKGTIKVWHVLIASHALAFVGGLLV
jgi:hypothetical protein